MRKILVKKIILKISCCESKIILGAQLLAQENIPNQVTINCVNSGLVKKLNLYQASAERLLSVPGELLSRYPRSCFSF